MIHFDDWFFYFTLLYSGLALALLPFIGCSTAFVCSPNPPGGDVTISLLVHREPLATSYAYAGALFLFSVVYCQAERSENLTRFVTSFLAAKLLAVPLIIPLDSVPSSTAHDVCGFVGAGLQVLISASVLFESNAERPHKTRARRMLVGTTAAMASAVVVGAIVAYRPWTGVTAYTLLAFEYVFGFALALNAYTTLRVRARTRKKRLLARTVWCSVSFTFRAAAAPPLRNAAPALCASRLAASFIAAVRSAKQ
jgi:hypothetical protein